MTHISRSGMQRKRVLVESNGTHICLSDVIEKIVEAQEHLLNLEYGDVKKDLERAKRKLREARKTLIEFEARIKGQVQEDVFQGALEANKNMKSVFKK